MEKTGIAREPLPSFGRRCIAKGELPAGTRATGRGRLLAFSLDDPDDQSNHNGD